MLKSRVAGGASCGRESRGDRHVFGPRARSPDGGRGIRSGRTQGIVAGRQTVPVESAKPSAPSPMTFPTIAAPAFVGTDDDGNPVGLPITDELLRQLADIKTDGNIVPPPTLTVGRHVLRGHPVAVVTVEPADAPPVRYRGRAWIRVGPRRARNRTAVDFLSGPVETRTSTYPIGALQQLVRNAVIHRTCEGTNAPVHVYRFDDRIEIISPGGPLWCRDRRELRATRCGGLSQPHPRGNDARDWPGATRRVRHTGGAARIAEQRARRAGVSGGVELGPLHGPGQGKSMRHEAALQLGIALLDIEPRPPPRQCRGVPSNLEVCVPELEPPVIDGHLVARQVDGLAAEELLRRRLRWRASLLRSAYKRRLVFSRHIWSKRCSSR